MNSFFGALPTPLPRTPEVEALHMRKIALLYANGDKRPAQLEITPFPDSPKVALSAKLIWLTDDPLDALIHYLTAEGIRRIHPDQRAMAVGASLALDLEE